MSKELLLPSSIFSIQTELEFEKTALQVFKFQAKNTITYRNYLKHLNVNIDEVKSIQSIPFLPISFFKTQKIIHKDYEAEVTFSSSGTTGMEKSKHLVAKTSIYRNSYLNGFQTFYGNPEDYHIIALLPNYLEQGESSLVYMVNGLIEKSKSAESGFFLDQLESLPSQLERLDKSDKKVLLIGVSYALLDLVELHKFQLKNTIILETGGMKGRRTELLKPQLHEILKSGFGAHHIHSEYGMTELLSQAYSSENQLFQTPPWMKVLLREPNDPFSFVQSGKTGGINVIDLANIYSCSFIATQDLGKMQSNDSFEILGRFDHSDIRGCNLLVQ